MQPRCRRVAGRVWESAVRDRVRVLGHDFRMVSLDVEVQTSSPSEKAIYLCVAIEPVEVRLWLDKSHPETDLAMGPVSGLGRTNAVVEPVVVHGPVRPRRTRVRLPLPASPYGHVRRPIEVDGGIGI